MSDSIRDRPKNEALTSRDEEPIVCTLGGAFLAFAIDESADHVCVTIPLPERASDMADALLAPFLPSNSIEGVPQNGRCQSRLFVAALGNDSIEVADPAAPTSTRAAAIGKGMADASHRGSVQSCGSTTVLRLRSENRERVQRRAGAARNSERQADEQKRPAAPLPRFAGQWVQIQVVEERHAETHQDQLVQRIEQALDARGHDIAHAVGADHRHVPRLQPAGQRSVTTGGLLQEIPLPLLPDSDRSGSVARLHSRS
jgi:hypothetical protein